MARRSRGSASGARIFGGGDSHACAGPVEALAEYSVQPGEQESGREVDVGDGEFPGVAPVLDEAAQ